MAVDAQDMVPVWFKRGSCSGIEAEIWATVREQDQEEMLIFGER